MELPELTVSVGNITDVVEEFVCINLEQKVLFIQFYVPFKIISLIRITCPCNEYPFKPHFYIAKLGLAGVYLFFLFLLQNIDCGYSLGPPRRGGSNVYPQSTF